MKPLARKKLKQFIVLLVFSSASAVLLIAHGVYFDLAMAEIKRVTIFGVIATAVIVFPCLLFIEWVFDWDNNEEMIELEDRVQKLEERDNS